jgi:hypothetical protein
MYFWNITKLKEEIRGGGPSENECFKYLLAFGIAFALSSSAPPMPVKSEPVLILLSALVSVGIVIAAMTYCYQMNGGAAGREFLKRFLSIAWVIGWRSVLVGLPVLLGTIFVFVYIFHPDTRESQYFGLIIGTIYSLVVIAITGSHIKDVSRGV